MPVGNEAELVMETISLKPPVFRVRDFLSPDERARIIELARSELRESHVVATEPEPAANASSAPPPRKSQTAWLVADADDTGHLERVRRRAMALTVLPNTVKSERLQVLRYDRGGYFGVHHESTAFLRRYATLLYYLEGPGEGNGGGTAFPLGPDGEGGVRGEVALAAAGGRSGAGTCAGVATRRGWVASSRSRRQATRSSFTTLAPTARWIGTRSTRRAR